MSAAPLPAGATRAEVEAFMGDLANVGEVVAAARRQLAGTGIDTIKIKSAALRPAWDLAVLEALRQEFGPSMRLRIDPNAGYSPARALALFPRLDAVGLEFFEDPTGDIAGMARLRRRVRTPLATNMCVIQFEHLPPAIRMGAVDIVLGDVYHWGGIAAVRDLMAVCEAFGLGFGIHSTLESEWDIGVAANLHLMAAAPRVAHAMDGNFPSAAGGIVTRPLELREGCLLVPEGPGLGITLDEAKLEGLTEETVELAL
jgi:glucarate dehydratase